MKIIAKKSSERGFIIEVDANEMANILGFSQLQEIDRSSSDVLAEGSEFDIRAVYKSYRELDVQKLRATITKLQEIIASLLGTVEGLPSPSAEPAAPARRKVTVVESPAQDSPNNPGLAQEDEIDAIRRIIRTLPMSPQITEQPLRGSPYVYPPNNPYYDHTGAEWWDRPQITSVPTVWMESSPTPLEQRWIGSSGSVITTSNEPS